jgi:hypothetical protein
VHQSIDSTLEEPPDVIESTQFIAPRWLMWVSIAGIAAIFGYLLVYHYHHESRDDGHLGDFKTFYQAAELARNHGDIYTAGPPRQKYVYPPLIAFLYTPLTALPRLQAARVMLFLTAAMMLGSFLLAARAVGVRLGVGGITTSIFIALLISLLNENEMRNQLTMLETDALMLLMFTLALYWLDRFPVMAGLALALAFNIKYLAIVTLPYLLLRRRWKAAGSLVIGSLFFAILPAVLLGWREDLRCLHVAFGGLLKWFHVAPAAGYAVEVHDIGDTLSLSITSSLAHLLTPRGYSDFAVMLSAACVGVISLGVVAGMYAINGFSLWLMPENRDSDRAGLAGLVALEWAGLVTVAVVFSPNTNTRHLLLVPIINVVGLVIVLMPRPARSRLPAIAGLVLILLSLIMLPKNFRPHYFRYGITCWGILVGYLLILWSGLRNIRSGPAVQPLRGD